PSSGDGGRSPPWPAACRPPGRRSGRPGRRGRPAPRRRSGTSPADRRAVGCASDSQAADRIEGDHLLEAPVAEAVDPAALEVPPGGLQMAGILDVADA